MFTKKGITISIITLLAVVILSAYTKGFDHFNTNKTPIKVHDSTENSIPILNSPSAKDNTIQVALLLDTSGSMEGLIEQAKSQLWGILNNMSNIQKEDSDDISLEIALYEYGNDRLTDPEFLTQLSPFTTDVDEISEKLFSLTTRGGDEYCGAVMKNSIENLAWTNGNQLKMIYIAGNESFSQGETDYKKVCKSAMDNGIYVNTIFCGNKTEGRTLQWGMGAKLANGEYANINQNDKTEYIETPYDDEIALLNKKLNDTYIPYGIQGNEKKMNLEKQDENANKYGKSNSASRSVYKSSKKYKAESWDLVDAYKKDKKILEKKELLNVEQNAISIEELERQIEEASTSRDEIKKQIKALDQKRIAFQLEHTPEKNNKNLESQFKEIIKKQAEAKGYQFKA